MPLFRSPRPRALALAISSAFALHSPAFAVELSPYFWNWSKSSASSASLVEARRATGLASVHYSFVVAAPGACRDDGATLARVADIRAFQAQGGTVHVVFGGAEGTYLETTCAGETELAAAIERIMQTLDTQRLDFNIEGKQLASDALNSRRARALALLQARYPGLQLTFTLPVEESGLTPPALRLLRRALDAGVRIHVINLLTMDFGSDAKGLGAISVRAAEASVAQLRAFYPDRTPTQLHAMLGLTPMIGRNDDGSVFTLKDAERVAAYARDNGLALLSFWAHQRDVPGHTLEASNGVGVAKGAFTAAMQATLAKPIAPTSNRL